MDESTQAISYLTAIPVVSGLTTLALGATLLYLKGKSKESTSATPAVSVPEEVEELDKSVSRVIFLQKPPPSIVSTQLSPRTI